MPKYRVKAHEVIYYEIDLDNVASREDAIAKIAEISNYPNGELEVIDADEFIIDSVELMQDSVTSGNPPLDNFDLTRIAFQKYVTDKGRKCPFCGEPVRYRKMLAVEDGFVHVEVKCLNEKCKAEWGEQYKLDSAYEYGVERTTS